MFGRICHLSCTNANVAWCLVPGSSTRRSRRTWLGQSRRYAAKELARLPTLGLSPSSPVPAAPKMNSPREPPASCVCSRKSRLCRHSPPNLIVWFPCSLVSVAATFHVFSERSHGRLPANSFRKTAAVHARVCDVVVVAHAAAHVHDELRAEDARPVRRRADGLVRAGAAEAGVGGSAVDAVKARIEHLRPLEAEAIGELV